MGIETAEREREERVQDLIYGLSPAEGDEHLRRTIDDWTNEEYALVFNWLAEQQEEGNA